ncbi:hypothetical protein SELMODRAFT_84583 [Selaginella moellendorffii]|uniref:DNA replication complex GINS protein SLD5 n=1 Tax=Selaginella moellendorffii TaxID=88036 RepID=D8R4R6_SELML|nr:DNA replication complex GINS protein SLD5 [Selaginella moellendorffii]EFJ33149.1 hypothetical protein SELMODRAFT_84583 [Selaginella moellendorffii]|eukprot:XP_002965729.1 DNA replication complex GINS protein SLD5 [Selaginella moellendorffii]
MADGEEGAEDWTDPSIASSAEVSDAGLLQRAWRNEKLSPELLPFQGELVERVKEQILLEEENLAAFVEESCDELTVSLYRMDLDRTLFMLRSYLRARLLKIEKFALHILTVPEIWERLSSQEQDYAQRFADTLQAHFDSSVLSKLPEGYKSMLKQANSSNENDMIVEPPLDSFVFCKCRRPISAFQLDDKGESIVDMENGDLYIFNYKPIKRLLETDRIELF